jgi:chromosome partitioning protein
MRHFPHLPKTTTGILVGAELALNHGDKVALLDSDVNQHASAFGKKAKIPNLTIIASIDEENVLAKLREAERNNDIFLVDLSRPAGWLIHAGAQSHAEVALRACADADVPDGRARLHENDGPDRVRRLSARPAIRAMTPAAQATHNKTSRPPLIAVLVSDHRAMPRQAVHGLDDLLAASVNGR